MNNDPVVGGEDSPELSSELRRFAAHLSHCTARRSLGPRATGIPRRPGVDRSGTIQTRKSARPPPRKSPVACRVRRHERRRRDPALPADNTPGNAQSAADRRRYSLAKRSTICHRNRQRHRDADHARRASSRYRNAPCKTRRGSNRRRHIIIAGRRSHSPGLHALRVAASHQRDRTCQTVNSQIFQLVSNSRDQYVTRGKV